MDEVYTCLCKGQAWSIHDGYIKCEKCGRNFFLKNSRLPPVWKFNVVIMQKRGILEANQEKQANESADEKE